MQTYGHRINQTARIFTKKFNEKLYDLGIFSSQLAIISFLHRNGCSTQVEISNYLNVEAPTITRTLARLEELGWVVRTEGKNKRERKVSLTQEAQELFPVWQKAAFDVDAVALRNISEKDLEVFTKVLNQIYQNLDSEPSKSETAEKDA
ncbi:MarR family winged helix-turn-helix transcriptional regulator [Brevibacillus migulae]|uniref:MarR family winged helix-turn-helix transcriptional regulator n=1 Tax=Brevibacillus migulae TaxID=1644114 RepID=UPI00106ED7BF|nr:MarR family transcriptional regulator [Brevibacillus migulae]